MFLLHISSIYSRILVEGRTTTVNHVVDIQRVEGQLIGTNPDERA